MKLRPFVAATIATVTLAGNATAMPAITQDSTPDRCQASRAPVLVCSDCTAETSWSDATPSCENCGGRMRPQKRVEHEPGKVDWPAWQARLAAEGIHLRGGAADESPEAYKPLEGVLEAHKGTVEIVHTLRPLGVAMADARTHDPFRD